MKTIRYIVAAIASVLFLASCKQAEQPFIHDDVEISAMLMYSTGLSTKSTLEATIDQEAGTILFIVPRAKRDNFDLTKVKLSATVFYDAIISPKLGDRIWDVTGDENGDAKIKLTVTSAMTGTVKEYTVKGYVSSK